MSWVDCKPAGEASGDKPKVTAAVSRGGEVLVITINSRAANLYFGGPIAGQRVSVKKDNGPPNRIRLSLDPDGQFTAAKTGASGVGGRIHITRPFEKMPRFNAKPVECEGVAHDGCFVMAMPQFGAAA